MITSLKSTCVYLLSSVENEIIQFLKCDIVDKEQNNYQKIIIYCQLVVEWSCSLNVRVCVCVNQQNKCKNTKFDNLSRALYLLTLIAATEYRNWLMYYSLPCMKGILDEEYYQHYSLLVGGITFLSGQSISPEQLEMAGMLLIHFVEMYDA